MPLNKSLIYSSALESAIDRHPLIVAPETLVEDVLALMSQLRGSCPLPVLNSSSHSDFLHAIRSSCALVIEGAPVASPTSAPLLHATTTAASSPPHVNLLLGIFTERDIVKLTAAGRNLKNLKVAEVMTPKLITLNQSNSQDIFTALSLLRQHRIRHLPIVDKQGHLLGIITPETIRKALQPANLLTKLRYVKDVMSTEVIHAPAVSSVLYLAELMATHRVSCVVITESRGGGTPHAVDGVSPPAVDGVSPTTVNGISPPAVDGISPPAVNGISPPAVEAGFPLPQQGKIHTLRFPVGIVTERDIVQFQALELDLTKMQAKDVMSTPLFSLNSEDSLWFAQEEMERRHVRRMVVCGSGGELVGLVSQTSLLQALDPTEMYGIIEALQRVVEERTKELKDANEQLHGEIAERKHAEEALKQAHDDLQRQVEERTAQLQETNAMLLKDISDRQKVEVALRKSSAELRQQAARLEKALQELQQTQSQLIQAEKMSSLGQLVAGIAHEINNPVNFVYGNLAHANQYIQDLLRLINLYRQYYPMPVSEIQEEIEAVDLDFLLADLPKLLDSMQVGTDRIRQIILSLRNFSRLDEAEMKRVNIHEGLDSTLLILQHRLKAKSGQGEIEVVKEYGYLPLVECYAGPLNQVFMNIISNAIDALATQPPPRAIAIRTSMGNGEWRIGNLEKTTSNSQFVVIRIADNGPGMTEAVRRRLFEPFFTTKGVGKGTGLGLSISYQIIIEKHKGRLQCISDPGQGTEFIIEIPIQQPSQEPPLFEVTPPERSPGLK